MLIENLPAFLYYFITLGVSLPSLILGDDVNNPTVDVKVYNNKLMRKLYSHKRIDDIHKKTSCLLYDMIQFDTHLTSEKEHLSIKEVNYILEQLIGDNMEEIYLDSEDDNHTGRNVVTVEQDAPTPTPPPKYSFTDQTFRDLFIWAILMNYIDMAKMLLAHINHRICAALIARKILKSFRDKYAVYSDKNIEYKQSMSYFEDYAIECVTRCYKNDQDKACELVLRQCEIFGNVTCLQVSEIVSR
jgi:hypothetical protein